MKKDIKNIGESIRRRLLNIAKKRNIDYNSLLLQFFQERFLYRLSISSYKKKFVLKGGLIFISYNFNRARPTKDIDLLGLSLSNDFEVIVQIIEEICAVKVDDGVSFSHRSIEIEKINEEEFFEYQGVRVKIESVLSSIKIKLSIDIGFGDSLGSDPVEIEYPSILDFPAPILKVYSRETVIAEKFETMVKLGIINSRMKDFYDVYFLASSYSFNIIKIRKNINATFNKRHTKLSDRKYIFSEEFSKDQDKLTQWRAFLKKNNIMVNENFTFIITSIAKFIEPIFDEENLYKENCKWDCDEWIWKS